MTNLAFGSKEDIDMIFKPELQIMHFMNLFLQSENPMLLEQVFWFFGNSMGDNEKIRDLVVQQTPVVDVMEKLISKPKIGRSLLKVMVWLASNINRYKGLDKAKILKSYKIVDAAFYTEDDEIITDGLWALSYMTDTPDDMLLGEMCKPVTVSMACKFLESREVSMIVPSLRVVGNFLTSNDPKIVDVLMWEGCLDKLYNQLLITNTNIIKETLWAYSNISAGS